MNTKVGHRCDVTFESPEARYTPPTVVDQNSRYIREQCFGELPSSNIYRLRIGSLNTITPLTFPSLYHDIVGTYMFTRYM
jgi:hypothetical protein